MIEFDGALIVHERRLSWGGSENVEIKPDDLPIYLWERVSVSEKTTLGNLISHITDECLPMWNVILGESIAPFVHEARTSIPLSQTDLEYLRVSWIFDSWDRDLENKVLEVYTDFSGMGPYREEIVGHTSEKFGPFAIEFSPLEELVGLPVKLDTAVVYTSYTNDGERQEVPLGRRQFTVLDLYKAIFYELTFHGTPEERSKALADLTDRIKEVDSGEVETIAWEDVKKKLLKSEVGH